MSWVLNGLGSFLTRTEFCNFFSTQPDPNPLMSRIGSWVITHFDGSSTVQIR